MTRRRDRNFAQPIPENESECYDRFECTIVGSASQRIVDAASLCSATAALGGVASNRILCEVPRGHGQIDHIVKILFTPIGFDEDPMPCFTKVQALMRTIVYLLCIDCSDRFRENLWLMRAAIQRHRSRVPSDLRPARAVILYSNGPEVCRLPSSGNVCGWAAQISEFEKDFGMLWKFGPIEPQDGNALHAIFSEICACRTRFPILAAHGSQEVEQTIDLDDTIDDELGIRWISQAEKHEEEMGTHENPVGWTSTDITVGWVPTEVSHSISWRKVDTTGTSSSVSSQEKPPRYLTEENGSDCQEGAVERHRLCFGI